MARLREPLPGGAGHVDVGAVTHLGDVEASDFLDVRGGGRASSEAHDGHEYKHGLLHGRTSFETSTP
jgi:hypothetical protein